MYLYVCVFSQCHLIIIISFIFLGTDTTGCVRIPASFCGIIGFRPSHGAVSTIGILPNSQSLDAVGMSGTELFFPYASEFINLILNFCLFISFNVDLLGFFSRDPSVLHRVGHVLLRLNSMEPRRARRLIFADDLFQLSKIPTQRTVQVVRKVIENLSGCKLHYYFMSQLSTMV